MTVDREQIRRDAEWLAGTDFNVAADRLAVAVPALLAELEQAERRVGELESAMASVHVGDLMDRLEQAEREREELKETEFNERGRRLAAVAQLAKVPPLVEAAKNALMWIETAPAEGGHKAFIDLRSAIAAFEQEQKPPVDYATWSGGGAPPEIVSGQEQKP